MIADSTTETDLPVEAVGTLAGRGAGRTGSPLPVFLGGVRAVQIKRIKRRINVWGKTEPVHTFRQACVWIPMEESL
jgi:hypothetical protein